jgi:hypothetical protein
MLALRDLVAGKLNVPFEDFMERGVLAPAMFGLSIERKEEIRLSVLVPESGGEHFKMLFESGHSLGRKDDFLLPRASLAGAKQAKKRVHEESRKEPAGTVDPSHAGLKP